ncbi:MAG: hypothetical protein AAF468_19340 [Pseudomonadota bacterium]
MPSKTSVAFILACMVSMGAAGAAHSEPQIFDLNKWRGFYTGSIFNEKVRQSWFNRQVAQTYSQNNRFGSRCVTNRGWCPIQPQPVGSPCYCGELKGSTQQ